MQKSVLTESTAVTKHKGQISLSLQDIFLFLLILKCCFVYIYVDMLNSNIAILFLYAKNVSFYFWCHIFYD